MDNMYTGMAMARSAYLPDWRYHDAAVLREYTRNDGVSIPDKPLVTNLKIEFSDR